MTHERPCCGSVCTCDGEDTWNEPQACIRTDDDCSNCRKMTEEDEPMEHPSQTAQRLIENPYCYGGGEHEHNYDAVKVAKAYLAMLAACNEQGGAQ